MTASRGTTQLSRWESAFRERSERYGPRPSEPARAALAAMRAFGARDLLELGAGQGRDTQLFAEAGLDTTALDFAPTALEAIAAKAIAAASGVTTVEHDVRHPLPFGDGTFDACYSHMLFCMALSEGELQLLAAEIRRVLRPGGMCIYTARTTGDPDFGAGIHRGERLYERDGFVVHYFDRELVERLATGYDIIEVDSFEEGPLPRRLWRVTMRRA